MLKLLILILLCFILAPLVPLLEKRVGQRLGLLLAAFAALIFFYLLSSLPQIASGSSLQQSWEWVPSLQVSLGLRIDGLSLLFGLLISGIGSLIFLYASYYLHGDQNLNKLYLYLLLFMGSMLGVVFSDNLLLLFVFWELTSFTSYFLIGFNHQDATARAAALQALLVTAGGGLLLLLGILMLGLLGGSFELTVLLSQSEQILSSRWVDPIVVLILIGAFTKSAQYPFHFWLPNAMAAPTPISAYLHSATMVKAGLYLIARLTPILGAVPLWQTLLLLAGLATMLLGSLRALFNTDLKRILAYTTVSSLGTITFLFGIGTQFAILAGCGYILAHALYKGALFMIAGIVDHEAGSRDITKLRGLYSKMPWTAVGAAAAALSMIGIPPFIGFVIKELVYEATLANYLKPMLLTTAAITTNAALAAGALLIAWRPFAGKTVISPKHQPHDPKPGFLFAPLLLALLGLLAGPIIGLLPGDLIVAAASSSAADSISNKLALWHGFNLPFFLSLTTILAALLLFRSSPWSLGSKTKATDTFDCENFYRQALKAFLGLAYFQTRLLQNGSLRTYLITILLTTVALVSLALLPLVNESIVLGRNFSITPWEVALAGFIIVGALAIIRSESRLGAVAALGVVGYGVALLFTLFGAPDLGITQFAIETLTVILFVFVLYRLPRFSRMTSTSERIRDLIVASCFGIMMALLILVVTAAPLSSRLSPFFAANSYLLAKGRNVVNVILVDFRALDTFGEITVITIAALGVFALLKLRMN